MRKVVGFKVETNILQMTGHIWVVSAVEQGFALEKHGICAAVEQGFALDKHRLHVTLRTIK